MKLLVGPVCAGVGLALQVAHSSTDGFSAGEAVWPWVQFDVPDQQEDEGDNCRKGVSLSEKTAMEVLLPGRSGGPGLWVRA